MITTSLIRSLGRALAIAVAAVPGTAPGQTASLLECSACHVTDGDAPLDASLYPVLNGKPARYLARQLEAYRTGLRYHPQMQRTAMSLGDGDAAAARLYADLPPLDLTEVDAAPPRLVTDGAWDRGIAPCASCHAQDPKMRARLAPMLHGQPESYLAHELRAYADGSRRSGTLGRMQVYAEALTPSEISDLAAWYARFGESDAEDMR